MAFSGGIFSYIMMMVNDGEEVMGKGFFYGYNGYTAVTLVWQGLGGLLIAMVIKYADNILKSFASSISIVFTYFFSFLIFGSTLSL
jgi:UDP-sugar transporter A1/2/3